MNPSKSKWYIIANPVAGKGKVGRTLAAIREQLNALGFDYHLQATTAQSQATELAYAAAQEGYTQIMAIGGDGTNNEALNGLMQLDPKERAALTYTLLPLGTGNDWIKTHRIPKRWPDWLRALPQAQRKAHDMGLVRFAAPSGVGKRYFANVAGMAYDAYVVQQSVRQPRFPYLLLTLKCLFEYTLPTARISFQEQEIVDRVYTINVGICRYSGGGMQLVPHADPQLGQLALTIVRGLSVPKVILNTSHLYSGKLDRLSEVSLHHCVSIEVDGLEEAIGLEVDGEYLGVTPVAFEIIPKAIHVYVPPE